MEESSMEESKMEEIIRGRAWKFGDNIDGDGDIFPFKYFIQSISGVPTAELACHVLENLNPDFGRKVQKGDFIVAGKQFGCGKAHAGYKEMKYLGVGGIIADSAARGFISGCVNEAIPILCQEGVSARINEGDELVYWPASGVLKNLTTGETLGAKHPIRPGDPIYPILEAGGYVPFLKKTVAEKKALKRQV